MDDQDIIEQIATIKEDLGEQLIILTHHYQCKEIVDIGHYRGDSLGLSQKAAADNDARFIVKYVENAPPDTTIIIGTEINLINRLDLESPDKTVLDLQYSLCPNMFKINPKNLLWALENIGQANVITMPEDIKTDARMALNRMLALA